MHVPTAQDLLQLMIMVNNVIFLHEVVKRMSAFCLKLLGNFLLSINANKINLTEFQVLSI